jgi:hypothetical protein
MSLSGSMLSKERVRATHSGDIILNFSLSCKSNLNDNSPPKFAIANGLFIGIFPAEFHDTTKTEHAMMNLAQSRAYVRTVFGGHSSCVFISFNAYNTCCNDVLASGGIKVDIAGSLT